MLLFLKESWAGVYLITVTTEHNSLLSSSRPFYEENLTIYGFDENSTFLKTKQNK